jgi:glycosyltransferase involved in cell wall biosynthesis
MKVSVIIPARDAKGTLADTLASVAAQTRRPAEVIVVDDCSTDGTGEIARDHAVVSSVIVAAGLGPAAATNLGVRQASGDWIALLDADDLWPAERLEQGIELAGRSGAHVVIGLVETFLDSAPEAGHMRFQEGRHVGFLPGAILLRRDVFLELGGFNETFKTGFFIDFWDRLTRGGHRVAQGDFVSLLRRIRPGSLSHRTDATRGAIERDFLAVAREAVRRRKSPPQ